VEGGNYKIDGITSLNYTLKYKEKRPLYTFVSVELPDDPQHGIFPLKEAFKSTWDENSRYWLPSLDIYF
jgi:hypothetical protein